MSRKYNSEDLRVELEAVGFYFSGKIDIPSEVYDNMVARLMQSDLLDRQDYNFLSVTIFHTLSQTFDVHHENELRTMVDNVCSAMTDRLLKTGILSQLQRSQAPEPEDDPFYPITSSNTIIRNPVTNP